ncbi:endonuclease/exonuclease/phosphatase family protein [Gilvimarinus sp. DA14]|uniref:endonuclease/exonuclease/phosphatase family protein n=1 Tax=Gilvimarinus sp. DA14 TaxID=2956798 RepID=UPI0020B6C036|nr:endonuclease/exonuclease/phosphatase family protein [Gilvimarinus sp. DA14]UTF59342.1 endonuclease/exonuclease/phosphatase family protein [Gilvimarinus sp. DA14]
MTTLAVRSFTLGLGLWLASGALWAPAENLSDEQAGLTDYAATPELCHRALRNSRAQLYDDDYAMPAAVSLLSWNIYKAQRENLLPDLTALSSDVDILLLQEALLSERLSRLKPYWRFAPGYSTDEAQTGVMTLSAWPASVHCRFEHTEPWLRTPKATSIVEYVLADGRRLLAVNIHAINFELGTSAYQQQLQDALEIVAAHEGPVILAGDLNSWSDSRRELLNHLFEPVGLTPAVFAEDNRTQAFGMALDHVWTRGVSISAAEVPVYQSSDHNPLLVSMEFNQRSDHVAQD